MTVLRPSDYDVFLTLSAQIGGDPLLTQGAGGNTSIKENGVTWVKASGTWLSRAREQDIMVPVHTDAFLAALRDDPASVENPATFVIPEAKSTDLRPSIETAFHCLLPQRVVAHFHGIDALTCLVRTDRQGCVAQAMAQVPDLTWQIVDYLRPGAPLAIEIRQTLRLGTDVLFLANHGVIVAGPTVQSVADRITRLATVFARTARPVFAADTAALARVASQTDYVPASIPLHHALATDPISCTLSRVGVLMPDQAIFLGRRFAYDPGDLSDQPALLILPGAGVLYRPGLSGGAHEMVTCMAELLLRLPEEASLEPLSSHDVESLLNWEAEKYRQILDRQTAP